MSTLVVVCGLAAEAKIASGPGVEVIAGGGDGAGLQRRLSALPADLPALLSFGVAGGLDPALRAGDVRIATDVVVADERIDTDPGWTRRLMTSLGVSGGTFAGSAVVVDSVMAKAALRVATRAALVDMETHIVAREARRRAIPWAAIRAVTDPAARALPHAAAVGMRPDGSVDLPAILTSLARHPGQLPGLIRAGLDARAAFAALLRCRQTLGPRFALFDFG